MLKRLQLGLDFNDLTVTGRERQPRSGMRKWHIYAGRCLVLSCSWILLSNVVICWVHPYATLYVHTQNPMYVEYANLSVWLTSAINVTVLVLTCDVGAALYNLEQPCILYNVTFFKRHSHWLLSRLTFQTFCSIIGSTQLASSSSSRSST